MADIYTEVQRKMLTILPMTTSPLSIMGSSLILYMLHLRGERRLYHRLMFALCVSDVISSCNFMLSTIPVPKEMDVFLAKGNTATCTASGFFSQLSSSTGFYNISLMLSFVCMVRYRWREEDVAARYEKYMHTICIGLPLLFGIVGLSLQMYNPVANIGFLRCFITPYPPDCDIMDDMECTRGEHARVFLTAGGVLPLLITVIILLWAALFVWWTVRQHQRQSSRHGQYNVHNTSRQVAVQSLIYGVVFLNTYAWLLIDPIADLIFPNNEITNFRVAVIFLSQFFYTSQGFFNFLVYIRPRYMRIRKRRGDMSMWWALREAVTGEALESSRYCPVGTGTGSGNSARNQNNKFLAPFRSLRHTSRQSGHSSRQQFPSHSASGESMPTSSQGEPLAVGSPSSFRMITHDGAIEDVATVSAEEPTSAESVKDDDNSLGKATKEGI